MRRSTPILVALTLVAGLACDGKKAALSKSGSSRPGVTEVVAPALDTIVQEQTLYVPVYSHVYTADAAHPLNLAMTLFVRNIDPNLPIVLTRVDYFGSGGRLIRSFVKSPLKIDPMASMDFFIEESDETGGPSPSFVVEWVATGEVAPPLAESIMIGTTGSQGISFTSPARVVPNREP